MSSKIAEKMYIFLMKLTGKLFNLGMLSAKTKTFSFLTRDLLYADYSKLINQLGTCT